MSLINQLKPSSQLVKTSLSSHSWLGIVIGALMYVICLSGTLVVFFEEFERWEQPLVEEYLDYEIENIQSSILQVQSKVDVVPKTIYAVLPTVAVPRIHVATDEEEWFVNKDGSLAESPHVPWTEMLKELHIYLHLPSTLGIIIVACFGAFLVGLIITGLLAHPKIFKDAFKLRIGGSAHLEQADIHNRLGVWGTPFYFIIGLTGAYIGLVGIMGYSISASDVDKSLDDVIAAVYGADPVVLTKNDNTIELEPAFEYLAAQHPAATPIYIAYQNPGKDNQYFEVAATLPERLIYSEIYRFNIDGSFINHQQLSDGAAGRQLAYSVYRLHFGHFGGFGVKVLYGLLGLALSVISVTGINIWLTKRKRTTPINHIWTGIVWGMPTALMVALFCSFIIKDGLPIIFWASLIICIVFCLIIKKHTLSRLILMTTSAFLAISVIVVYYLIHQGGEVTAVAHGINLMILLVGLITLYRQRIQFNRL